MKLTTSILALLSFGFVQRSRAADIIVTNATDIVNGDTSGADALLANPGLDGVSLREAVMTVDNTPGSHTITFSNSVAGSTIALQGQGLQLTRDGVTLAGPVDDALQPLVTITGPTDHSQALLTVFASGFTMTNLNITGVHQGGGVAIFAGRPGDAGAQRSGIVIEGNVFDNETVVTPSGFMVSILADRFSNGAGISNVRVRHNRFANLPTDSLLGIGTDGATDSRITDVVVEHNEFTDGRFGFEFGAGGVGNRTSDIRVLKNTFTRNSGAIPGLVANGSANLVENVLISENVFTDSDGADVGINGGLNCVNCAVRNVLVSGNEMVSKFSVEDVNIRAGDAASGCLVENVTIERNRIRSPERPISIIAGLYTGSGNSVRGITIRNNLLIVDPSLAAAATLAVKPSIAYPTDPSAIVIVGGTGQATGNQVDGVSIVNNTLVARSGYGVWLEPDNDGAAGNSVRGISVLNTIINVQDGDFRGEVGGDQVSYCLLTGSALAGANHNISGNPRFVDPANNDFHLKAGSPAIDAARSVGAPCYDLEDKTRFDDPAAVNTGSGPIPSFDIGAYEFGGAPTHFPNDIIRSLACDLMQIAVPAK
jgi:hypothetical protein